MFEISLLGNIHFRQDNRTALLDLTKKQQALLVYLISYQRPVSRSHIYELFWEGRDEFQARSNLRTLLTRSRKHMGPLLEIRRETVGFNLAAPYWLDIAEFRRQLSIANQLWYQETFPSVAARKRLEKAINLYKGDFLLGFRLPKAYAYMDWVEKERNIYKREVVNALRKLIFFYVGVKDFRTSLEKIEDLLYYDMQDETIHQLKMYLLAIQGQKDLALNHFSFYSDYLTKKFQLQPGAQLFQAQQEIGKGLVPDIEKFLSNEIGKLPKSTLQKQNEMIYTPPPTTPLIGRKAELAELNNLINHPGYRLITITGAGGIGKTHLALAAAHQQKGEFLDGVVFVPLGGILSDRLITDDEEKTQKGIQERLLTGIANALKISLRGKDSTIAQLISFLRNKEILMILDNFEHILLDTLPLISELLEKASEVSFLITSREQLYLVKEKVVFLSELPVPSEKELDYTRFDHDEKYVSIYLFTERAKRVFPRFELDSESVVSVARICRLVGGVPLAIELAATWVGHFSCLEIADAIEQNIHFLATSLQGRPERHQSIHTVFNYSWDLLTEQEKNIFLRLAIFSGSFSRVAAEAITEAPLSILVSLVNKSMLRLSQMGHYEIHPLLRLFAQEKLDDAQGMDLFEPRATHELAYGQYYLGYVQEHSEALHSIDPEQAIHAIKMNLENITQAWQLMLEAFQFDLVLNSIEGLSRFYHFAGLYQEAILTFTQTREYILLKYHEIPEEDRHLADVILARIQGKSAYFYNRLADYEAAAKFSQFAIETGQESLDRYSEAEGLINWGEAIELQGPLDFPKQMYTKALLITREINDLRLIARCLKYLGKVAWREGDLEAANQYYEQAMEIEQQRGDQLAEGQILNRLGLNAEHKGEINQARVYFEQVKLIYQKINHKHRLAGLFLNLGRICFLEDEYHAAKGLYQQALKIFQDTHDRQREAASHLSLGSVQLHEVDPTSARESFSTALSISRDTNDRRNISRALYALGLANQSEGKYIFAQDHFIQALEISELIEDHVGIGLLHRALGLNYRELGQYDHAERYLELAMQSQSSAINHAYILADMALVLDSQGEHERALVTAKESFALATSIGQKLMKGIIQSRMGIIYTHLNEEGKAEDRFLKAIDLFTEIKTPHLLSEAHAGMVQLHLIKGENKLALDRAILILRNYYNAHILGLSAPFWVMGVVYQALMVNEDARQADVMAALEKHLQATLNQIYQEQVRQSFLKRLNSYNNEAHLDISWEALAAGINSN